MTLVNITNGLHIANLNGQFPLLNLFDLPKSFHIADSSLKHSFHGVQHIMLFLLSSYRINLSFSASCAFPFLSLKKFDSWIFLPVLTSPSSPLSWLISYLLIPSKCIRPHRTSLTLKVVLLNMCSISPLVCLIESHTKLNFWFALIPLPTKKYPPALCLIVIYNKSIILQNLESCHP